MTRASSSRPCNLMVLGADTRVVVQGITGREGAFHAEQMMEYGTRVVAGVTPGRAGSTVAAVPVFDSVQQAVDETRANTSIIFVPPAFAADAICEGAAAKLSLVICITEGIPTVDVVRAVRFVDERGARLIGPNCPGVMTPGSAKVGIMPADIFREGTSALSPGAGRSPTKSSTCSLRPASASLPASVSAAIRSSARRSRTCSSCSGMTKRPVPSSSLARSGDPTKRWPPS